jgi:hypothetical protein
MSMANDNDGQGQGGGQQQQQEGQSAGQEERLARLEETQQQQGSALERIETALANLMPGSRAEARDQVEGRLDRPSSVQEQVRAELERARQEQERAAAEDADKADRETVKQRLAKLEEMPPRQPVRRATRLLGWGDGSR